MESATKSQSNGLSPVQSEILEALNRLEPYSATRDKLSEITGQRGCQVGYALHRLEEKGLITSKGDLDQAFYCPTNGGCRKVSLFNPTSSFEFLDKLRDEAQVNGWKIEKLLATKSITNGTVRLTYGIPEEAD